jgi:hypothetical protein
MPIPNAKGLFRHANVFWVSLLGTIFAKGLFRHANSQRKRIVPTCQFPMKFGMIQILGTTWQITNQNTSSRAGGLPSR